MSTAFLFPGQGSQGVGMGKSWYSEFQQARETFQEADDTLGLGLSELCFEGPEETLRLTENAQPALLTVSTAIARVMEAEFGIRPSCGAGHSLGEFSALVCAGAIGFADALRVVRERGRAMQEAVPVGEGGMVAVFGLAAEEIARLCREAAVGEVLEPANFNGGGQVVVAGTSSALDRFVALARAAKAKRVLPLAVSAPFHCTLMEPAAERLSAVLEGCAVRVPRFPVVANVTGEPYPADPRAIRELLCEQVTKPVLWEQSVQKLVALYRPRVAVEVGPGRVLAGLVRRIVPDLPCFGSEDPQGLQKVVGTA